MLRQLPVFEFHNQRPLTQLIVSYFVNTLVLSNSLFLLPNTRMSFLLSSPVLCCIIRLPPYHCAALFAPFFSCRFYPCFPGTATAFAFHFSVSSFDLQEIPLRASIVFERRNKEIFNKHYSLLYNGEAMKSM